MSPTTSVVHASKAPFDVYIGRAVPRWNFTASIWANPYKIGLHGNRREVIDKYRAWLTTSRPDLMARLPELRGKALGCWCRPLLPCHGDVLAELADAVEATP